MQQLGYRFAAAFGIVGFATLITCLAVALSNADEAIPDFTELRAAINAAAKRGENVDEIRKALDNLQKSLASGWTKPVSGKTIEPSPELLALRESVEAAARKGESVAEILKHLEIVEKELTGKVQSKPKPLPPVDPTPPRDPFNPPQEGFPPQQLMPVLPGNGLDAETIKKAEELMRKASELLLKDPNDPEARKMMQQGKDMFMQGVLGGGRRGPAITAGSWGSPHSRAVQARSAP
jgi:hypothetical protein